MITTIFFDLDHTLWDFDKNSEMAFELIFKASHPTVSTERFIEKYAPINQACWKLYQNNEITHEELRYNRLKHTFDAINYSVTDIQINQLAEEYIEFLPENNYLFEGAIELLDYLNDKYQLHIITNGFAEVQYKKIANSNLDTYFKTITNSEMAGAKKPNPLIYHHALTLAKAKKEECIMIGDCLEADVQGALDFGIDAIFFNPNANDAPSHIKQVSHLLQLKTIL